MQDQSLAKLRQELLDINYALLDLLNRRAEIVLRVKQIKDQGNIPPFSPEREHQMLQHLLANNVGPFSNEIIGHLFKEIFRASLALMESQREKTLKVSRQTRDQDLTIAVGQHIVGKKPIIIAGPCAVESQAQMQQIASALCQLGISFLRGGTYKPRSSPYAFQGLGKQGLEILQQVAQQHNMVSVTEVMDTRTVELAAQHSDILQIGTRNMHNYALLREVGNTQKPILLKRGLCATLDEFLWAAEYIVSEGNPNVIMCERGIRTFETQTRNTLDISAIALLRQKTYLPVIADISHAAGRKDILVPLARATLAAGANGIMVEVHPFPPVARSDSQQQLDLDEFKLFLEQIGLP